VQRDRSAAISGIPDVLPTRSEGQPLTRMEVEPDCGLADLSAPTSTLAPLLVAGGTASAYLLRARKFKPLPAGFVIPAQPLKALRPPSGSDRVHEIKHDGYRMIVRRDGPTVRLYSRNANDWTKRLRAIADRAERITAKSFTIDGEAVVLGPDGLSRFEELSRREAADTAVLYAFDLIEHDSQDIRNVPFLDRKAALARLLRNTEAGIRFNEHIAEDGPCLCTRLPVGRRGHRVEEDRQHLRKRPRETGSAFSVDILHFALHSANCRDMTQNVNFLTKRKRAITQKSPRVLDGRASALDDIPRSRSIIGVDSRRGSAQL
jgi:hypothetical protein